MRKIIAFIACLTVSLSLNTAAFAEAEETAALPLVTDTEYGSIVFADNEDLLTDIEETYVRDTITDAVKEKNISIGVVSTSEITQEISEEYYGQVNNTDQDFALLLFNENEHGFFFFGAAQEEFAEDEDALWLTEGYFEENACFAAALQFPLDVQYHYVAENDYAETTTETVSDEFPEDYFTESANNGIHTVKLENGHIALLHDLDDSLTENEEAQVLTDLMNAVRETDFNIGIVITDNIGDDKSDYGVMDFTDVYYEDYCGIDTDGILLLINNDTKYDWISTSGSCIDKYYDAIDPIFDDIYDYLVDGNYSLACQRFVQEVKYYSEYSSDYYDDYYSNYDDSDFYFDGDIIEDVFGFSFFGIIIAIIAVSIFAGCVNSGYKMKKNVSAANYKLINSLVFTQSTDTFLRTYTTRRHVSSSSSGSRSRSRSSGSRSHRSSGGGRHGGGGRRR